MSRLCCYNETPTALVASLCPLNATAGHYCGGSEMVVTSVKSCTQNLRHSTGEFFVCVVVVASFSFVTPEMVLLSAT